MVKHHLKFKNIHPRAIAAAEALFEAKPWRKTEDEQVAIGQAFLKEISGIYDTPVPSLSIEQYAGGEYYTYSPQEVAIDSLGNILSSCPAHIRLHHWSILTLFAAARVHHNESQEEGGRSFLDFIFEDDSFDWACSLFYTVKPRMFRARVREGRMLNLKAKDTYSSDTWGKLTDAGLTNSNGDLLVTPAEAKLFLSGDTVSEIEAFANEAQNEAADRDAANLFGGDEIDSDNLESLNITQLRQLSRGVFSGGYSLRKPELIAKLREHGVRA